MSGGLPLWQNTIGQGRRTYRSESQFVSKFKAFNGQITGQGTDTILLLHGFGTDQTAWGHMRPQLDAQFRVVSFDLAGSGPKGADTYDRHRHRSLFGFADDLIDILDELEVKDCLYVGHSVAGMIGATAAVTRPDLFRFLAMIGASPRYLNDQEYGGGFEMDDLKSLFDSMAANFQAWGAGFAPAVVGVPDNAVIDEFSRTLFLMRPDIALSIAQTIFQSDMREVAARLDRPTAVIQTLADFAVPMAVGDWIHAHVKQSTLDIVDAAGHLPHMTAPKAVLEILKTRLQPFVQGQ